MRNGRMVSLLLLGVLLPATSLAARGAEEDSQIAAARERYAADSWPEGPRRAGLDLERVDFPGLRGSALEYDADGGEVVRRYRDAKGQSVLLVELHVRDEVAAARTELLVDLAFVQSVKELPRTADRGIAAGDVGYVGLAGVRQDRIEWIAFVEGNLELRVLALDPSAEPGIDVARAAERLSAAIRSGPALEADQPLPRPTVVRAQLSQERCQVGDDVAIDVQAVDAGGEAVVLEYVVRGTAQGHVETRRETGPRLRTTKAGTLELEVRAWNRLGVPSRTELRLEVDAKR